MNRRLGLTILAMTLSAFFARGQGGESPGYSEEVFRKRGEDLFQTLDVDKDGYLLGKEIPEEIRALLNQAMARPDTRLDLRQFQKYREEAYLLMVTATFRHHDRDGDGYLEKYEMPVSLLKRVGKYSRAGDRVSFKEFLQYSRDRDFPAQPPRGEPGNGMGTPPGMPQPQPIIQRAETVYSEEVYRKRGEEAFHAHDVDKDGYLMGQEIPQDIRMVLSQANASPDTRLNLQQFLKYREAAYLVQVTILFKNHDRNDDGFLEKHEMPLSLLKRLPKYNSGRDRVNFKDFLQYSRDRDFPALSPQRGGPAQGTAPGMPAPMTRIVDDSELDSRPTVYRANKLPKGLPEWFERLDADKDGQISLVEWRKAGMPLTDFAKWDRNDDGLLTYDEVLDKLKADRQPRAKRSP
jgi:Ca2+-binding EF-hand superfamily protein